MKNIFVPTSNLPTQASDFSNEIQSENEEAHETLLVSDSDNENQSEHQVSDSSSVVDEEQNDGVSTPPPSLRGDIEITSGRAASPTPNEQKAQASQHIRQKASLAAALD
ncbi:unnamed protein product [Amaranthus hypochondriacus]